MWPVKVSIAEQWSSRFCPGSRSYLNVNWGAWIIFARANPVHQNQGYPLWWTRIKMGCSAGICGALLFLIYILPLAQLIKSYGLDTHGYADDSQLYVTFRKTNDTAAVQHQVKNLEQSQRANVRTLYVQYSLRCLCNIDTWMAQNKLKLNNGKTEIILFGYKKQLAEVNIQSLDVAGTLSMYQYETLVLCLTQILPWFPT